MGIAGSIGGTVARKLAPATTGGVVRDLLERAIDGVGPVGSAARSGDSALAAAGGDVDRAVERLIDNHRRLAAAQGFITNVGGLVTMAVTVPANITGLALIQCHLAAAILHLRGYDLSEPAVRDAVLVCLLDGDTRKKLTKETGLTMTPAALATAVSDPGIRARIAKAVTGELIALTGGKQVAGFLARRIPVLGGAVGGVADALSTSSIGREAARTPLASSGPRRRAEAITAR